MRRLVPDEVADDSLEDPLNGTRHLAQERDCFGLAFNDGRVNRLAWDHYATGAPNMFALGPYASPEDVRSAICFDLFESTFMILLSTYDMLEAYHGWSLGIPPTDVITSQQIDGNEAACDPYLGD